MSKIIGVTVGSSLPKPNFKQTDPTKGDYIKNKPDFDGLKSKVEQIEVRVDTMQENAYDDTELRGIVSENVAKIDTLNELVGNTKVETQISDAVDTLESEIDGKLGTMQSDLDSKVDAEDGKGLSTNDYTDEEQQKLRDIEPGANYYEHPTHSSHDLGLYKVTVDDEGHVSGATTVEKEDILAFVEKDDIVNLGFMDEDSVSSEISDLNDRIDGVEGDLNTTNEALNDLSGEFENYKETNNKAVSTNTSNIEANKTAIEEIQSDYLTSENQKLLQDGIDEVSKKATANANAIEVLNGDGNGSVKQSIDNAFNEFAANMTDDKVVNTYKELINYAAKHGPEFTELVGKVDSTDTHVGEIETDLSNYKTSVSEQFTEVDTIINDHVTDTNNPHNVTKYQVGLDQVDNTSDMDKPISHAVDEALQGKADSEHMHEIGHIDSLEELLNELRADVDTNAEDIDTKADLEHEHNDLYYTKDETLEFITVEDINDICGFSDGDVGLTSYATEQWVRGNYQPKGDYLTTGKLPEAIDTALGYTPADVAQINQLFSAIANKEQLTPEFANSVEDCIDPMKIYVLPDGYLYAYMSKKGLLFTNQILNAVGTDGKPYNGGLGYKSGYWLNSNGTEAVGTNCIVTGYIPISNIADIVLRVSGFTGTLTDYDSMKFYNSSFANIPLDNQDRLNTNCNGKGGVFEPEPAFNNTVSTFTFDYQVFKSKTGWYSSQLANGNPAYVRFALKNPDLEKMVVTINEPIAFGTTSQWVNTGHAFVPADYEERIVALEEDNENHETRIKALEMYGSDSTSADDIPAYIKTEADDVINRLIEKQGDRNFTMVGLSDFHYSGMGDNKDNLIRACKAISHITNRIHVDAIATLGDNLPYGESYDNDIRANADRWSKEINEILAVTQRPGIVDFRTPGNHDRFGTAELYMPDNAIYSFISGYNRQCDYVNAPIGYAYRDFVGHNLRVIVLNTAETEGKGRFSTHSGFHMSTNQYKWLIDTLDMSSKPNATDWQILVLSHHKADDWQVAATNATSNNYILPNILHAYNIGGSYTGTNAEDGASISCNFAGKNQAKLIGQIHGHHHAYIYGKLLLGNGGTQTNVMAISTPTSGFGTGEGHNDDNDGNWYDSVKDTAEETAFCVYSIDLDNHVVHAIHYGNGVDREISY